MGAAAITLRARALGDVATGGSRKRVFVSDTLWAVAAAHWLGTGLWRAFGGLEKGTVYYLEHPLFHAKLALFGLVLLLEIWPMVTLIRWRIATRSGATLDPAHAATFARISWLQLGIVVSMVFLATAIARGLSP